MMEEDCGVDRARTRDGDKNSEEGPMAMEPLALKVNGAGRGSIRALRASLRLLQYSLSVHLLSCLFFFLVCFVLFALV